MITPPVRALTTSYYSAIPNFSYYYGCSTGGAQGYAVAEMYPDLFDGIYAESPGNWYSHLILGFLWNAQATEGSGFVSQDVLGFIISNILDVCDSVDGVIDRLIENPFNCIFDITTLGCTSCQEETVNGTTVCLTTAQLTAAQAIYASPKNSLTGEDIYPGFGLGSESAWLLQETTLAGDVANFILKEVVFKDLSYNISSFDFDTDVASVDSNCVPAH